VSRNINIHKTINETSCSIAGKNLNKKTAQ